ncbi:SH3 domain-containing protein [Citrobacter werkmanii]|uniref:Sulfur carrier protein ThiS n=1 Tax=Citrobacter werkmanii TaxID=67827 RepID=A0ABM8N7J7_9ENTR|nr:SH3 domain-containing protein [Citrobacter werkmanii]CAB5591668.1 sulfur carrier protein ThiS [Citrobacter werkmanii]CAB5645397.1 sulfur carrier protein ThiS [Citrobacter werkmanii]CAC9213863.1 sulfur carrier protein ThiS [Citrobacter werkmanii]CAC9260850.1 sulfur carrier protein ThiS [Citrobacter werkmanii]CAC9267593.1 sulfur carrier protein ThiS [Citrobacter werkmanii]
MNDYQSKKEAENNLEDSSLTERQNKNNSKDNLVNKFASLQKMENLTLGRSIADSVSLSERITKLAQGSTIADSVSLSERMTKLAQGSTIADSVSLSERITKLVQGSTIADSVSLSERITKLARGSTIADSVSLSERITKLAQGSTIADSVSLSERITKLAQGSTIVDSVSLSERITKLARGSTIADSVSLSEKIVKLAQGNSVTEWSNLAKSIKKTNNSRISEKLLIPAISGLIAAQAFSSNLTSIDISSPLIKQITNIQRTIGNDYLHSFIKDEDYDYVNTFLSTFQSEVEQKETDSNISLGPDIISPLPESHSSGEVKHTLADNNQHQLSNTQLYDNLIEIFNLLPSQLRKGIVFFVTFVLIPAIGSYFQEKVLIGIHGLESYAFSLVNDKSITKHEIVNSSLDIEWDALSKFRVITGNNVRLRTSPSMNSEVIEHIGKNTVVAVLESKERQWLLVQVQSGDELITGWITRTYTKPIKG